MADLQFQPPAVRWGVGETQKNPLEALGAASLQDGAPNLENKAQ